MKLVHNWEQAWKWFSVHVLAIIAILPFAWDYIPPDVRSMIPYDWQPFIFSLFAGAGIVGRVVKQDD